MRPIFCAAIITLVTGLSFARDYQRTWKRTEGTILEKALIRVRPCRGIKRVCVCVCALRGKWSVRRSGEEREIMRKWLPPFTRPLVSHRWKWDGRFPLLQRGKNEFARVGQVDFCFLRPRDSILFLFTRLRAKFNSDSSSLIRAILAERLILVRCTIYRDDLIETRYYSLVKKKDGKRNRTISCRIFRRKGGKM